MILNYTVTADDRRQAWQIYDSGLAPTRWLTMIAQPFSFMALGFGIYCYAIGNRALAFSLFVSFGYLFSKGLLLRFFRNLLAARRGPESEHFQLETSELGIAFSVFGAPGSGSKSSLTSWTHFQGYSQTPEMFVLSLGRVFYAVPSRSLTATQVAEFDAILCRKLTKATVRTGTLAVRHTLSVVLLGFLAFFFFGGTIQRILW